MCIHGHGIGYIAIVLALAAIYFDDARFDEFAHLRSRQLDRSNTSALPPHHSLYACRCRRLLFAHGTITSSSSNHLSRSIDSIFRFWKSRQNIIVSKMTLACIRSAAADPQRSRCSLSRLDGGHVIMHTSSLALHSRTEHVLVCPAIVFAPDQRATDRLATDCGSS